MQFIHYDFHLQAGDVVEVEVDKQANVRLLDSTNFSLFRSGRRHQYRGGLAVRSPVRLAAPYGGSWHVVVYLGGRAGSVRASARILG